MAGNLAEILSIAKYAGILLQYERKKVMEVCLHKPKGMLQILWEQGYIDPNKSFIHYTKDERKKVKTVMSLCKDQA